MASPIEDLVANVKSCLGRQCSVTTAAGSKGSGQRLTVAESYDGALGGTHQGYPFREGSVGQIASMETQAAALTKEVIRQPQPPAEHPLRWTVSALIDRAVDSPIDCSAQPGHLGMVPHPDRKLINKAFSM